MMFKKTYVVGLQGREKFDDIFIRVDTIPAVTDGQTRCRSKDRASRESRG